MKGTRFLFVGILLLLLSFFMKPVFADPPKETGSWELTFEENFDSPQLDESKWFPGYRLGRLEYYKRIGFPNEHGRGWPQPPLAHYVIENGIIKLRVTETLPKRAAVDAPCVCGLTSYIYRYNEKSGKFDDHIKFSQKYGWFEMRCRVPAGSGFYSAFWLHQVGAEFQEFSPEGLFQRKSGVVEIDIFEWLGKKVKSGYNEFNVHFAPGKGWYDFNSGVDGSKDFHTWAIDWQEGQITWYFDGKQVRVYKGPTPPRQMYLLMALFYRGFPSQANWLGPLSPDTKYPIDFEIDYVRVWKRASGQGK